jgi:hypothetical protein
VSDFSPGVERAQKAGHKITVGAYPLGAAGVQMSLDVIARKIRDGRLDPDVKGWAGDVLIAAGRPRSIRDRMTAIVNAFRAKTMYLADPVGAEYITSPEATMCLRPGLCVRSRDCDDGCVAVGAAAMSAGIVVRVLKQSFGPGRQEHVLLEAQDESGVWFPVDPSTELPVGQKVQAVSEVRIDPMSLVGSAGTSGAEIVTLGAAPEVVFATARELRFDGVRYTERRYGRWWSQEGLGWVDVGAGNACCASCARGQPCEKARTMRVGAGKAPVENDLDAPCSSCELYAERIRRAGMYGTRPRGVGATAPAPSNPAIGGAAAVGIALALALAGGVGWHLGRRL